MMVKKTSGPESSSRVRTACVILVVCSNCSTDRHTDRQTDRQTNKHTDTQTDTQTDRQTNKQTHRHTDRHTGTRRRSQCLDV